MEILEFISDAAISPSGDLAGREVLFSIHVDNLAKLGDSHKSLRIQNFRHIFYNPTVISKMQSSPKSRNEGQVS